jgi:glutamine amidotransferase
MIAIIKYNAGNIRSVENALKRLGCNCLITDNPDDILGADKVIFPGVGEASSAMAYLEKKGLDRLIVSLTQPVLGICLGLQLMCRHSEEGNTGCLNIFDADVHLFPRSDKVPHMGWNNLRESKGPLFRDMNPEADLYFVHSYFAGISGCTAAVCDYILPFSAAMQKGNFHATQFHPEKSSSAGEKILKNFLAL